MPPLADLISSDDVVWKDNRVVYKYRRIIRDIIELFEEFMLSDQYCHWDIRDINIVNDRVRKDSVLNPDSGPIVRRTCKTQFISMVGDILGNGDNERELNHFYHKAKLTMVWRLWKYGITHYSWDVMRDSFSPCMPS
ncbi:PREDICTED: LOC110772692 [Prunus dulcis]|uniref:PREDICTED: LOC110772692 n=1 Tax=Prunus dulcis TaxID=3755 RepID=A0A5E4EP50_PRUDU|nr:PREDICTED: LOC110772692 [Prunus dulcis]